MAIDTMDKADTGTDISIVVPETGPDALRIFTDKAQIDTHLAKVRAVIDAFEPDLSTAASRKRIASLAFSVSRSKTYLDGIAQKLYAEQSKIPKQISDVRKHVETTLDKWRDQARAPLTKWEAAEKDRVAKHTAEIGRISRMGLADGQSAEQIRHAIANLEAIEIGPACEEYVDDYTAAKSRALSALRPLLALREQQERDQAELAQHRKAEAERQAQTAREKAATEAEATTARAVAAKRDEEIKRQIAAAAAIVGEEPGPAAGAANAHEPVAPHRGGVGWAKQPLHPNIARAFDEIDAAIFSGDAFRNRDALGQLKIMVARWQRAIPDLEASLSGGK